VHLIGASPFELDGLCIARYDLFMINKALVLLLLGVFACSVAADDDEMKTEVKPGANPSLPVEGPGKLAPPAKPPSPADFALRTKLRKRAPFWIDDSRHGAAVRINKDGTFSSEAQGGGSIAGSWKTMKGELHLQWSGGGEKYSYPVIAGKDGSIRIRGQKPKNNRYNLN